MQDLKYMKPREFQEIGLLHEVNRLLLHPLGLAMEMTPQGETDTLTGRIWDCRDDAEGIIFDVNTIDPDKAGRVCELLLARKAQRFEALRYVIQPIPDRPVLITNYTDPDEPARA